MRGEKTAGAHICCRIVEFYRRPSAALSGGRAGRKWLFSTEERPRDTAENKQCLRRTQRSSLKALVSEDSVQDGQTMLSQLCRAQLCSSRKWSFNFRQEKSFPPNVFRGNNNDLHEMSSDEENDHTVVGGCSDCSFQDSCCCCCCCCRLVDHRTQGAMVVMQCVQLGGASGPLLPMGTLVTALYRHRDWVCVQTPHGVRGFVRHGSCAPLGTLLAPNTGRRSRSSDNLTLRRNLHPHPVHDKFYLEKNIDTFGGSQDSRAIHTANASNVC